MGLEVQSIVCPLYLVTLGSGIFQHIPNVSTLTDTKFDKQEDYTYNCNVSKILL